MTALLPSLSDKQALQAYYRSARLLLSSGIIPPWAAQRGFEEILHGFLNEHAWRVTHISHAAAAEISSGYSKNVQRAHGIAGRLDRYERTVKILSDPEQPFDEWWPFYFENDATVLITKKEHGSNKQFQLEDLIQLPSYPHGMFIKSGFSFKVRKNLEVKWIQQTIKGFDSCPKDQS